MSTRTTLIISVVLIALAVGFSIAVYGRLPDPMASHWGMNDEVNGTISRFWGAFLMPFMAVGMLALFLLVPAIDPMKANIASFRSFFNAFIVAILAFLLYLHVLTILWNLGYQTFRMSAMMIPAMGLLFIFIGLLLRKAKRNFFIGIRTPWTLSSDHVWAETHRVGGILFVICGVIALFGVFLPGMTAFWLLLGPLFASTIFLLIYSYVLYRRETGS